VEQKNRQKPNAKTPYLARQMSERKSSGRVAERTRPNPKMRRGLSGLPVYWKMDVHTRTRGFRVVQAAGA
jgi:hypothetical protein